MLVHGSKQSLTLLNALGQVCPSTGPQAAHSLAHLLLLLPTAPHHHGGSSTLLSSQAQPQACTHCTQQSHTGVRSALSEMKSGRGKGAVQC